MAHSTQVFADTAKTVETLNALLRGELSAVDSYMLAIDKLGADAPGELFDSLHSHRLRSDLLTERIHELRGRPAESAGLWNAFASLFAGGPALLGRKVVLVVLADCEDRISAGYDDALAQTDADSLRLLERDLMPEQQRTRHMVEVLLREGA